MKINYIIAGITGHLAKTKLIEAPELLLKQIPNIQYTIFGISRKHAVLKDIPIFTYTELNNLYKLILDDFDELDINIIHLCIPPEYFLEVLEFIIKSDLVKLPNFKILLEKPFAKDYLNFNKFQHIVNENEILSRSILFLDHYLYKQEVLNILETNNIAKTFELNKKYNFELMIHEDKGIEDRGDYFDKYGIVYDMFHSHGIQLFVSIVGKLFGKPKLDLLKQVYDSLIVNDFEYLSSQYDGYLREKGVSPTSVTITKMYLKLTLNDNGIVIFDIGKKQIDKKIKLTINQEIIIDIENSENSYVNVLKYIYFKNYNLFLSFEEILLQWKISDIIYNS